jgi:hypothetical protein
MANIIAMTFSALLMLTLLILSELRIVYLAWSWLVIWGTLVTFGVAWFLGPRIDAKEASRG